MNAQPLPPKPAVRAGGHKFYRTRTTGILQCPCGAQCMVVVRLAGTVATMRAFNLYRHPLLTTTTAARGLLRAKGWSTWTPTTPQHAKARR